MYELKSAHTKTNKKKTELLKNLTSIHSLIQAFSQELIKTPNGHKTLCASLPERQYLSAGAQMKDTSSNSIRLHASTHFFLFANAFQLNQIPTA